MGGDGMPTASGVTNNETVLANCISQVGLFSLQSRVHVAINHTLQLMLPYTAKNVL